MADAAGDAARAAGDAAAPAGDPAATGAAGPAGAEAGGQRGAPVEACPLLAIEGESAVADPGNHCAASDPPLALSLAQQRLVCLDAAHVDCPRFVRSLGSPRTGGGRIGRAVAPPIEVGVGTPARAAAGSAAESSAAVGAAAATTSSTTATSSAADATPTVHVAPVGPVVRSRRRSGARPSGSRPTPLILAAGVLVAAAVVALAFTSLRGGLSLPGASPSDSAVGSPAPSPSASAQPSPTPAPTPTPTEAASPTPTPVPSPTPSPTRSASPSPTPTPSLPAAFQGLKPCTDAADCYLYRVRSGDSLTSIAAHFGVTLKALKAANPEIKDPSLLHVGDVIRIPLPGS